MCGILGILSQELPEPRIMKNALDAIAHRGPDDEGYLFVNREDGSCIPVHGFGTGLNITDSSRKMSDIDMRNSMLAFGTRRLAIIDLSREGHQPMSYAGESLWITYNGEIFNYRELKSELLQKGYKFRSRADTEVVLAAYAEWGEKCVERFNGQWAFCIYDGKKKRLFCSRDRFGIKPFYYWWDGKNFVFASEIKALLQFPFVERELDRNILADFIIFRIRDQSEESYYRGIFQLLPAENLTFDIATWSIKRKRYYYLRCNDELGRYDHEKATKYAGDIRDLLIDAVKLRLTADVPVGSCLSGGLDSSSIVVIIQKLLREQGVELLQIGERQKTFTASYDDPSVDETAYANEIVRRTGVDAYYVHPTAEGLWREWDTFLYHHEGTCFSSDVYAGWNIMRLASQHVKVVLNGQGGDELFGGYRRYELGLIAEFLRLMRAGDLFETLSGQRERYGIRYSLHGLLAACYAAFSPGLLKEFLFNIRNRRKLEAMKEVLGNFVIARESFDRMFHGMRSLNETLFIELTRDYLSQLLHYDDRNAAAFSIENRVPFLDHRLVEYVNEIPAVYKIYRGWSKWLLRLAMKDLLPDKVLWRKDKMGFGTPAVSWMRDEHSAISLPDGKTITKVQSDFLLRLNVVGRLVKKENVFSRSST
jgi:asparagine synthase (glutamine-hydrolysing)